MFGSILRRGFFIASLGCLVALFMEAPAKAQLPDNGVITFTNHTAASVTIELNSVLLGNGTAKKVDTKYQIAPNFFGWLPFNEEKLAGVACVFIIHTPDGHQSRWAQTFLADFNIPITDDLMKQHANMPLPAGGVYRELPNALSWRKDVFEAQMTGMKSIIATDEEFLSRKEVIDFVANSTDTVAGVGADKDPSVVKALTYLVVQGAAKGLAKLNAEEIAAARNRLAANKAILQTLKTEHEKVAASLAAPPAAAPAVPTAPGTITIE